MVLRRLMSRMRRKTLARICKVPEELASAAAPLREEAAVTNSMTLAIM